MQFDLFGNFASRFAVRNKILSLIFLISAFLCLVVGVVFDFYLALFISIIFLLIAGAFASISTTWGLGAKGEDKVAKELEKLGDDYRVVNDFHFAFGNIDHIVIGKNGIFAIETKNWQSKSSMLDGNLAEGASKQAARNACELNKLIQESRVFSSNFVPWVFSVVVFTNAAPVVSPEKTQTTSVSCEQLCSFIKDNKSRIKLSPNEVSSLFGYLSNDFVASSKRMSFEELRDNRIFQNYLQYILFGIVFGVFFNFGVYLIYPSIWDLGEFVRDVMLHGIIVFVMGKLLFNLFEIRLKEAILRVSCVYFVVYLPLFVIATIVTNGALFDPLNVTEFAMRFLVIVFAVLVYRMLRLKLPD